MIDPLDTLAIPKPFYRRPVKAVLAAAPNEPKKPEQGLNAMAEALKKAGIAPAEKAPMSPEEASAEIRKVASEAIAKIMETAESDSAYQEAANQAIAKITAAQEEGLKAIGMTPKIKPIPPRSQPPAAAPAPEATPAIPPTPVTTPEAEVKVSEKPKPAPVAQPKPEAKPAPAPKLNTPQEQLRQEIDAFTRRINEAKTDEEREQYRRTLVNNYASYAPELKEKFPEPSKSKPTEQPKPTAEAKAPEPVEFRPESSGKAAESKPYTPDFTLPNRESREKSENERLKKELEDLRRELAELKAHVAEKTEQRSESGPVSQVIQEEINRVAVRMARPGFVEQANTRLQERLRGITKWGWSILEKRAQDNMAAFEARSKAIKAAEEQFRDKSFWHTAVAPVWFGLFGGKWYGVYFEGRWRADRKREGYAGLYDKYHHYKEVREHQRNDLFNIDAARVDALLKQFEGQAKESQQNADAVNKQIEDHYREHNEQVLAQQGERDPKKRIEMTRQIDDRLMLIDALQQARAEELDKFARAHGEATKYRSQKDNILKQIRDLSPEPALVHEEVRKKPGRRPVGSKAA